MAGLPGDAAQRLRQLIAQCQLGAAEELILANAVQCCRLKLGQHEDYTQAGNSRYGGLPDLPPSFPWPRSEDYYLHFLMQVNLADLPPISDNPLPSRGLLCFFLGKEKQFWDVDSALVFYDGPLNLLSRANAPPREETHSFYLDSVPHRLACAAGIDLPDCDSEVLDQVTKQAWFSDRNQAWDNYFALLCKIEAGRAERGVGKLLGYPSARQGDMRENAYLAATGSGERILNPDYCREHKAELQRGAKEWRLLWRIDTASDVGDFVWESGSVEPGSFLVLIRDADLARRDFSQVYVEIESS